MFSAKNSYLACRDKILHGLDMDSINAVLTNYDDMESSMKDFLENVATGIPE